MSHESDYIECPSSNPTACPLDCVKFSRRLGHTIDRHFWEFLSHWQRRAVLRLCDYTVRAMIKFALPVRPVILLLSPSSKATDVLEEDYLRFHWTLIRMYALSAREFAQQADIHLLPFVPVMQGDQEIIWETEKRIYSSELPSGEKADLVTAMTIFAGLKDSTLARQLVERRRDIMIQSAAYEIIKQEGFDEGMQQGMQQERIESRRKAIYAVLEKISRKAPGTHT